jgi:hypothetical protein
MSVFRDYGITLLLLPKNKFVSVNLQVFKAVSLNKYLLPSSGDSPDLWNVRKLLPDYAEQHTKRLWPSRLSSIWEIEVVSRIFDDLMNSYSSQCEQKLCVAHVFYGVIPLILIKAISILCVLMRRRRACTASTHSCTGLRCGIQRALRGIQECIFLRSKRYDFCCIPLFRAVCSERDCKPCTRLGRVGWPHINCSTAINHIYRNGIPSPRDLILICAVLLWHIFIFYAPVVSAFR